MNRSKVMKILFGSTVLSIFFLLFYKLDYTALSSYDEAWYGEISRNLAVSKNPFNLMFDGRIFLDHPPFGFMLMAIPALIFGSNEFSVRLVSALLGAGSVFLLYLLGRKMGGRAVGISAGAILLSSMWFIFRARSGNLDVPFMFFEILTVYLLLHKKRQVIYLASLSFAALILTKTLVGFGLVPVILLILFARRKEIKSSTVLKALALWFICVVPWYYVNQQNNGDFLHHHFFDIGARGSKNNYALDSLASSLSYLQIGIGKWYKVFLVSVGIAILSFIIKKTKRFYFAVIFVWMLGFSVFLLSSETEIWHLLPLYPMVALIIPMSLTTLAGHFLKRQRLVNLAVVSGVVALAIFQFNQFSNLFYFKEPVRSDERDISVKAGKYQNIYLMDVFYPAAVYYSKKNVKYLFLSQTAYEEMGRLMEENSDNIFIVNGGILERLEKDNANFRILEQNPSYAIIAKKIP